MYEKQIKPPPIDYVEWLMDTGCGHDLVGKETVKTIAGWMRNPTGHRKGLKLCTANGTKQVESEIPLQVGSLGEKTVAVVLPSTPAVLSIGRRCQKYGYTFCWPAFSDNPYMIAPSGIRIDLFSRGYVPYLGDYKVRPHGDPDEAPCAGATADDSDCTNELISSSESEIMMASSLKTEINSSSASVKSE